MRQASGVAGLTCEFDGIHAFCAATAGPEPVTCLRDQSIAEPQARLIESNSMIVVLLDRPAGQVLGVVTLHDLLRAQAAMSATGTG